MKTFIKQKIDFPVYDVCDFSLRIITTLSLFFRLFAFSPFRARAKYYLNLRQKRDCNPFLFSFSRVHISRGFGGFRPGCMRNGRARARNPLCINDKSTNIAIFSSPRARLMSSRNRRRWKLIWCGFFPAQRIGVYLLARVELVGIYEASYVQKRFLAIFVDQHFTRFS